VRAGRADAENRPLREATDQELRDWAHWDPEPDADPDLIKEFDNGIQLRTVRQRSTPRRRLQAEAAGEMPAKADAAKAPAKQAPKSVAPRKVQARVPLGRGLQQLIGALGLGLAMSGRDPGVGMALQFEAPIAGDKLDAAIQGTVVDRVVQPLARAGEAAKDLGSVLALPFLVGLIERRPELYPVLREPVLRPLVTDMALQLAEAGQRAEERLRKAQKASGTAVDSDALLAMLFEGRPPAPPADAAPAGD
jgi:hypothetical protein